MGEYGPVMDKMFEEVAVNLLKEGNISTEVISRTTGIPEERVKELAKEIKKYAAGHIDV